MGICPVAFLASNEASYITGAVWPVDGAGANPAPVVRNYDSSEVRCDIIAKMLGLLTGPAKWR